MAGCVFFAGMETGVISVNRLRLRHLVRHNVRGAKIVEMFLLKPDLLLGTTLVGNNLCAISSSIVAASMGYRLGGAAGTTIAAILFTVVLLVVGSSLVVYPAASLPLYAKGAGARLAIINRDRTPADGMADVVIHASAGPVMTRNMEALQETRA